jgi:CheY-like chemotaxis protein
MSRIYIIDDEIEMTDSISLILEGEGYETACQNRDHGAVENILRFGPDLIILDVMFPGNNSAGFEIARQIRRCERLREVPILMLSGINERYFGRRAFSDKDIDDAWMPVNHFVDKPVNPQLLLTKVRELTSAKDGRFSRGGGEKGARE